MKNYFIPILFCSLYLNGQSEETNNSFGVTIPSGVEMEAEFVSYLGKGQSIDSDNLAAGPLDAMEEAGIFQNDYWVRRSSSERMKDPENPRVIIYLKNYEERGKED